MWAPQLFTAFSMWVESSYPQVKLKYFGTLLTREGRTGGEIKSPLMLLLSPMVVRSGSWMKEIPDTPSCDVMSFLHRVVGRSFRNTRRSSNQSPWSSTSREASWGSSSISSGLLLGEVFWTCHSRRRPRDALGGIMPVRWPRSPLGLPEQPWREFLWRRRSDLPVTAALWPGYGWAAE